MKHELKILERFYSQIENGEKTFEIRKNDRNFKVGDTLIFNILEKNTHNSIFIGNLKLEITNVFKEKGFGLEDGYCILSFKKI